MRFMEKRRKLLNLRGILLQMILLIPWWAVAQEQKVTICLKEVKVQEIFKEINRQTGLDFVYSALQLGELGRVSLDVKNETVDAALGKLFDGKPFAYKFDMKSIIVRRIEPMQTVRTGRIVRGRVTAGGDEPLPGVTVLLKGTQLGTVTDEKGEFKLELYPDIDSLLVTFVGMKPRYVGIVPGKDFYQVRMEEEIEALDEVLVTTGYQSINKTRMTGAVEVVTAKDISNKGYVSVGDVLRGTLAGVSVRNTSGKPGALPEIRIRGLNSLYGDMNPTWIVDGVPFYGNLNDLVPEDIESITVLKDAAATAIYGSQAANGVIVVKRKQGREGTPSIRLASTFSFETAPKSKLDLMNSREKIAFERSVYADYPNQAEGGRVIMLLKYADMGKISRKDAEAEIARLSEIDTDWYDVIFRSPFSHNHNLSFSGGSERTQYYGSLTMQKREGLISSNDYNNWSAMLRLSHDFNKRLRFSFSLFSNIRRDKDSDATVSVLHYATFANPYERPYDEAGNYAYDRSYSYGLSSLKDGYKSDFNILNELRNNTTCVNSLSNSVTLDLEVKILENLKFVTTGSVSSYFGNTETIHKPGTYTSQNYAWLRSLFNELPDELNNGSLQERNSRSRSYTWSNRLEYTKGFGDSHFLNVFLGHEMAENMSNNNSVRFPEYDPEKGLTNVPVIGADKISNVQQLIKNLMEQGESRSRSVSFFASAGYSYKDRYILSGSMRLDGVDIIGTENRFSPLWNASFKYNLHKEAFMERFGWLNEFALRFSYGYTGSIDKEALPFNVLSYSMSSKFFDIDVPSYIRPKNPSVKWQRKQDRSLGLDLAFLKNRIRASVNYYNNVTRDLLDSKTLPVSVGISTIKYNSSSVRNYGVEVSLRTVNVRTRDLQWTTFLNLSHNKSKIIESFYKDVAEVPLGYSYKEPVEGTSTSSWIGYKFAGIDPLTGHTLALVDNRHREHPIGFQREDGSWVLDMDDQANGKDKLRIKETLGDSYPPIAGGFGTTLLWKQWTLNANFSFMLGHEISSAYYSVANGGSFSSAAKNVLRQEFNRWRKPGDITDMPGYNTSGMTSSLQGDYYDRKLETGDFLKCTELSLGYYVPSKWCRKLMLESCRVNLNVRDVFTVSKYKGLDPENFGGFTYPNSRKYMLSLSIGF